MMTELVEEKKDDKIIRSRSWLGLNILLMALLLLLVGGGIGFYYTKLHQMTQSVTQLSHQITQIEQARAIEKAAMSELEKATNSQAHELQQQHQSIKRLALFQQQRQWQVDQIRYLVNLANISLLYSQDMKAAFQMLRQAHTNILAFHDAALDVLDQAISSDMKKLATLMPQEVPQVFFQVTSLDKMVDEMPLLGSGFVRESDMPDDVAPVATTWKERLMRTLRQLRYIVDVRKTSHTLSPLVAQEQGEYINQYLHMQLGQAQWAVLHHDNAIYQASLDQVDVWVNRYYVILNPRTQDVLSALIDLKAINVRFPEVTLSRTMNALKEVS